MILQIVLKYWIELIFSLILTTIALLHKRIVKQVEKQKCIQAGVCALLSESLHSLYHEACKSVEKDGGVSVSISERVDAIYSQYTALGGNGTGKDVYEQMRRMPIISRWGKIMNTDPAMRAVHFEVKD